MPPEATLTPPFLRRVGILGDVHGADVALDAALNFLLQQDLSAILCTGDIADENVSVFHIERCTQLLTKACAWTVRGNHDRWHVSMPNIRETRVGETNLSDEAQFFLTSLLPTLQFETVHGPLLLCHGVREDDMAGIYPESSAQEVGWLLQCKGLDAYHFLVCGHTHKQMIRRSGEAIIFNPGSLCDNADASFMTVDFEQRIVQFYKVTNAAITTAQRLDMDH